MNSRHVYSLEPWKLTTFSLFRDWDTAFSVNSVSRSLFNSAALARDSHYILQLLLDRWFFEYRACPRRQGPHLLQTAAAYADIHTVRVLTITTFFEVKI